MTHIKKMGLANGVLKKDTC